MDTTPVIEIILEYFMYFIGVGVELSIEDCIEFPAKAGLATVKATTAAAEDRSKCFTTFSS